MSAATPVASESDLLMVEHTGKVENVFSDKTNSDVWGMPGWVSNDNFLPTLNFAFTYTHGGKFALSINQRVAPLVKLENEIQRNLSQTFEDASNGGVASGNNGLPSNDTSLTNLARHGGSITFTTQ